MSTAIRHIRGNLISWLALFVALGGTSYAAFSVPANSVGVRQIRNGSITPSKFNGRKITGYVRHWARLSAQGNLVASSPRTQVFSGGVGGGEITWHDAISPKCMPFASVDLTRASPPYAPGSAIVSIIGGPRRTSEIQVLTYDGQGNPSPRPVDVILVCP
jgi:hypothetical protein